MKALLIGIDALSGFICLDPPTRGMMQEVAKTGQFEHRGAIYDRVQIRTVEDLLAGRSFATPSRVQTLNWHKQMILLRSALKV
jgi:hypothetical protein